MMNRATAISVLFLVILSALAKDANGQALDVNVGRELKGKSSKSRRNLDVNGAHVFDGDRELKGKSSKGSKSRRALDLDGESELEFDEVELDELNVNGVEIVVFEGDRVLKGKSGGSKSGGSKSGKSRRNLDVDGAHVLDGNRELKGKSSKGSKSRRALNLDGESDLEFEDVELEDLEFEGFALKTKSPLGLSTREESSELK